MVAAFLPLLLKLEEQLLGGEIEEAVTDREPTDVLPVEVGGGVLEKDMPVVGEVGIERQADEAVLLSGRDGQLTDEPRLAGIPVEGAKPTAELDPIDGAIRGDRQFHRLRESGNEGRRLEAGRVEFRLRREGRQGHKQCRGHCQPLPHARSRPPVTPPSCHAHRLSLALRLP